MKENIDRDLTIEGRLSTLEAQVGYLEGAVGGIHTKLDKILSNGSGKKTVRWMIGITIMNATLMVTAIGIVIAIQRLN